MEQYLEILRHNCGFDKPDIWVETAKRLGFKKVPAQRLYACPDCESTKFKEICQYVYYSQLMRLQLCVNCHLVFSDVHLDESVLIKHFESGTNPIYQDDLYVNVQKADIFKQIRDILVTRYQKKKRVLDVGGCRGHLAKILSDSGFDVTLSDISSTSCQYAREQFGLKTINSDIKNLRAYNSRFNVVLMCDVLHYEPDIHASWDLLSTVLEKDGVVIMRLPNKLWWIRPYQRLLRTITNCRLQTSVYGFNPEHIYWFTNRYLKKKFASLGFTTFEVTYSPSLRSTNQYASMMGSFFDHVCRGIYHLSARKLVVSPSMLVIAERRT